MWIEIRDKDGNLELIFPSSKFLCAHSVLNSEFDGEKKEIVHRKAAHIELEGFPRPLATTLTVDEVYRLLAPKKSRAYTFTFDIDVDNAWYGDCSRCNKKSIGVVGITDPRCLNPDCVVNRLR